MSFLSGVDVVVVNWNGGTLLEECISSLPDISQENLASITVVDNGSTDGSGAALRAAGNVTVIENGSNLGFGKACNIGAFSGGAEFILFLNPDARVAPGILSQAVLELQSSENVSVAVLGVKLLNDDGSTQRSCARFPEALTFLSSSLGVSHLVGIKPMHMTEWDHATTADVDHVIGAFYLVRRSVFAEVQGFDERFFVYLEDLDLSRRIRDRGYRIRYTSDISAYHTGGGVSSQVKAARLFYSLRSRIIYSWKHFSPIGALGVCFMTLGPEFISRLALLVFRRRWREIGNLCKGYSALWRWFVRARGGRRASVHDREPLV